MYLKRLEIMGFKSFADKIRLEFLPGVTAVVGPNGSGKSNISDALRWVLGEQSIKNLRGMKMDDVIFAGCEKRKPLSLAEVTIVLDNSDNSLPVDFSEISVTRKLFRSGESDYLINKSPVRLKDVLDLFYDTGLGKEAYSVIGQGKIDALLSAKADERRAVFEEAAGIIKYKSRKQVAERKLEETDRNLLRVQDILRELETQLGPLENQATLAKKYLALKGQLSELEINHFGNLVNKSQEKLAELAKAKAELQEKYQDFEGEENVIDSAIEGERLSLLNQDNAITQLNEDYFRLQNQIERFNDQITSFKSRISDLEKQEAEIQTSLELNLTRKETILQEQSAIEAEISSVKSRLVTENSTLTEQESALAEQNQQLIDLEKTEESLKSEFIEILNEIASLKNNVNSASLQRDFICKQLEECQKKQNILKDQGEALFKESEQKHQALIEVSDAIINLQQLQGDLSQRIQKLEAEFSSVEAKNLEWKERIRVLESKINLLDEMEKSFQGYFQGVKALLADAAGQPFYRYIKGIVADLIKVKPGMELAIETALGSSLQHIVIESDQHAQAAIAYLKKNSKGRATFLPLNLIHLPESRTSQIQSLLQQYSCQPAVALLEFDAEYRSVLNYLLGQTIIAPNLDTAVKISTKIEKSFRIVTPEGDLVNPGGSITGGSVDKQRLGLLTRKREIEEFKKERQDSQAFLEKGLQTAKDIKAELHELALKLNNAQKAENESQIKRAALEREKQTVSQELARCQQEYDSYTAQLAELTEESGKFDAGREELQQAIANKENLLKETETKINLLSINIRLAKEAKEATTGKISELRSVLSAASQEESGKLSLKDRLQKQLTEIDTFCLEINTKKEQLLSEKARTESAIAELVQKIASEKDHLLHQEQTVSTAKQVREQILQQIKELENKQRSFRRKSNEFQNQLHKIELAINQVELESENYQRNLVEDYGPEWIEKYNPDWELPENASGQIELLKTDLRDLGPVNLAAIEDFQQIKQRFDFLTSQSEDLVKAKESLEKVIREIEGTITKRFNETFELVRDKFKQLFAELFEGGNAELFLVEPEQPLVSGIEIIAQPPGKKLQSLSLLSGGERAMTAIALLFSILSVKPSPFCILDEIDATLDEVNVSRFSKLLELFSKNLQFIVITHRRGTMESANALYGVTMEEQGVSKLISLDLNQKAG